MIIIEKIKDMQELSNSLKKVGKTIAFVPTMGYLHKGHTNLMKYGREFCDIVVASIFVNPAQFAPNEDFEKYPRDFDRDCNLAENAGADYIFHPEIIEMYPRNFATMIRIEGVTEKFEGIKRPGHFDGVATIVAKLFNAVLPDIAIFGQKDYQQTAVIRQLTRDFNIPVKIVIAPTTREEDGLAMSSRNIYLSPDHRKQAPIIYKALEEAREAIENGERRRKIINAIMHKTLRTMPDLRLDYASSTDADTFDEPEIFEDGSHIVMLIACYIGKTRLIDNTLVSLPGSDTNFNQTYVDLLTKI